MFSSACDSFSRYMKKYARILGLDVFTLHWDQKEKDQTIQMSEVESNRLKDKLNAIHTYTYSKALPPINQPKTNTKQAK